MNTFIQSLSAGWHPLRFIYLIIGAMLMTQAWMSKDLPFALVGGIFLYQSIFNTGCCGMSGAFRANAKEESQRSLQDTDYTEIK
jgi:hypothetical protein